MAQPYNLDDFDQAAPWFLAAALNAGRVADADTSFARSLLGNYLRGSFSDKQYRWTERLLERAA